MRSWLGTALVILVLVIVFAILQPRFLSPLNLRNITSQMSVLLVISVAGTIRSLSEASTSPSGRSRPWPGWSSRWACATLELPGVVVIGAALGVGIACGLLNGVLFAKVRIPSFLVTLGTLFALDGLASFIVRGTPI